LFPANEKQWGIAMAGGRGLLDTSAARLIATTFGVLAGIGGFIRTTSRTTTTTTTTTTTSKWIPAQHPAGMTRSRVARAAN